MDTMDTFLIIILGKLIPHASSFEKPKRSLIPYNFLGVQVSRCQCSQKRLNFSCFCHCFNGFFKNQTPPVLPRVASPTYLHRPYKSRKKLTQIHPASTAPSASVFRLQASGLTLLHTLLPSPLACTRSPRGQTSTQRSGTRTSGPSESTRHGSVGSEQQHHCQ